MALFRVLEVNSGRAAAMKRHHVCAPFTRCLARAQAADSEREDALARLRTAAEETAQLKGKANYADSLRVYYVQYSPKTPFYSETRQLWLSCHVMLRHVVSHRLFAIESHFIFSHLFFG